LSSSVQSGQQVTKLGETLFSTPFVSRPISSTGVAIVARWPLTTLLLHFVVERHHQ